LFPSIDAPLPKLLLGLLSDTLDVNKGALQQTVFASVHHVRYLKIRSRIWVFLAR
jgi:hypothetical protein